MNEFKYFQHKMPYYGMFEQKNLFKYAAFYDRNMTSGRKVRRTTKI